jgi:hypothetical protein
MRLINVRTFQLEEFAENEVVDYVILSHTWGKREVTYHEFLSGAWKHDDTRNRKIIRCCARAVFDGFEYCWIDTCCINKDSSAELSEAINSMYKWYAAASICYAYLEDFPESIIAGGSGGDPGEVEKTMARCRWFTRGWTLQELIAPAVVEFYAADWSEIGTKMSMQGAVSRITSIPVDVLTRAKMPRYYNVAERMSWAARRQTTRLEDEAYCLMGLFDVHMPMIYGEKRRAFRRLQEEILKLYEDYSMFAWPNLPVHYHGSLFAPSPAEFIPGDIPFSELENTSPAIFHKQERSMKEASSSIFNRDRSSSKADSGMHGKHEIIIPPPSITSRGVCVTLPICDWNRPDLPGYNCLAAICAVRKAPNKPPLMPAATFAIGGASHHGSTKEQSRGEKQNEKENTTQQLLFIQLKRKDRHFRTHIRTHVSVPIKHPSYKELIPQSFGIKSMEANQDWIGRFAYTTLFVEDHEEHGGAYSDVGADTAVDVRFSQNSVGPMASTPVTESRENSFSGSGPGTPSIPQSISLGPEATCTVQLVKFFDPRRPPFAFDAHVLPCHTFKPFGGLSGVLVFAANASNMSNATSMVGKLNGPSIATGTEAGSGAVAGAPITVSFGARNDAPWCSVVRGKTIAEVENLAQNLKLTELLTVAAEDENAEAVSAARPQLPNGYGSSGSLSSAAGSILTTKSTPTGPTSAPNATVSSVQRRATQTDRCRVRLTPVGVNPVFWMDVSIRKGFRSKNVRRPSETQKSTNRTVSGTHSTVRNEDKFIVHVNVVKDLELIENMIVTTTSPVDPPAQQSPTSSGPGLVRRKAVTGHGRGDGDSNIVPLGMTKRVSTM